MNNWIKSAFGMSAAGLFVLLVTNGPKVIELLTALWLFLLKLGADAPLGLSSFLLALAIATASIPFVTKGVADLKCAASRDFVVMSAALALGCAVMFLQLRTLKGALLGILAGLLAPYIHQGIAAVSGLVLRSNKADR